MNNKKNVIELGGFIPLLQGEETEKRLRNYPGEKVKISFVCGINSDNLLEVFLQFSVESGSGRIDMDPVQQNRIDPLHMHRLMKLIDRLSALEIGQMFYIMNLPIEWEIYRERDKKKISKVIGLKKSEVEKIMEEVPFNLDEIIWNFKQHGIAIDTLLTQEAALKGQIKISRFYKELGIRTAAEIAAEKKKKAEIAEKYRKYLNAYFNEESKYRVSEKTIMDSVFENFILEAIRLGAKDEDIIVGYALCSVEDWMVDSASMTTSSRLPGIFMGINPETIQSLGLIHKKQSYDNVIAFLQEYFPETKRMKEDYIKNIFDIKNMQEIHNDGF